MKQEKVSHVVNGIRKGPGPSGAEPGVDEKHYVEDNCDDDVRRPCPCVTQARRLDASSQHILSETSCISPFLRSSFERKVIGHETMKLPFALSQE